MGHTLFMSNFTEGKLNSDIDLASIPPETAIRQKFLKSMPNDMPNNVPNNMPNNMPNDVRR